MATDWGKERRLDKELEIKVNQSKQRDITLRHGIWAGVCALALVVSFAIGMYTVVRVKQLDNTVKIEQLHFEVKK